MSGRKSKNSPVKGFVAVQSGSGSFFGLSARATLLEDTLSQSKKKKRYNNREADIDINILKRLGAVERSAALTKIYPGLSKNPI
jgi:hypothetical protein